MVEESDIKYDEVARKLAMVEGDLQRADERWHLCAKLLSWLEFWNWKLEGNPFSGFDFGLKLRTFS